MKSFILVDGTDLTSWANRRDAQGQMPRLLRKLIYATVERLDRISFPAGEGISIGGWDGIVSVENGNVFVPSGTSVWEMGTNRDIKGKADEDYEKRVKEPLGIKPSESTFIFISPRRWANKEKWISQRQKEGIWREVRAYDADDLEMWLEVAPAVHVWLSIQLGKHPENAMDVESFWTDWSEMTSPSISPEILLCGRVNIIEKIRNWLGNPSSPISIKGESREEALDIFSAVLQNLADEERTFYLSRLIIVNDMTAWQRLIISDEPLILVPTFYNRDSLGRAIRKHRVVIPLGRDDSESSNTIVIPSISTEELSKVLIKEGIAKEQARDLALLARRSLKSFRRKIALNPELQQPNWSRPVEGLAMLAPMLVGTWNDNVEGDCNALSVLSQLPYEELNRTLVRWSNEADAPVRKVGNSWYIVSKEDAWFLLSRYLTRNDLERFEEVALEILGTYNRTYNPKFDLQEDRRWMAGGLGYSSKHSELIKEGISDTLALMGARGESPLPNVGVSARVYVKRIVQQLLEMANKDWKVWASLSNYLPLIAEASPDEFLVAVENGSNAENPILFNLFMDKDDGIFNSSPHPGLLWIVNSKSDNFFKGFLAILNRRHIA